MCDSASLCHRLPRPHAERQECMAALETIEDEVFSLAWADGNSCYIACGDGKARTPHATSFRGPHAL